MKKVQQAVLAVVVVAGVLAVLLFQHQELSWLRAEQTRLQSELAPQKQTVENQRLSTRPAAVIPDQSLPADQFTELLRLRGEAGVQRNELEKLRASVAAGGNPATSYFPKKSWESAGFATPEAALLSFSWAMGHDDLKTLLSIARPDEQAELASMFAGKIGVFASESNLFTNTHGLRVVHSQVISDQEVAVTYLTYHGPDARLVNWGRLRMKRTGAEWKPSFANLLHWGMQQ